MSGMVLFKSFFELGDEFVLIFSYFLCALGGERGFR